VLAHGRAFTVAAGQKFDFTQAGFERGVDSFRVLGIDPANALNPSNSTAFVTGLTFTRTGEFTGTMKPLTATAEVRDLEHAADSAGDWLEDETRVIAKELASGNPAATCGALDKFLADVAALSSRLSPRRITDLTDQALAIENAVGCP
jgi:hypothetical protein